MDNIDDYFDNRIRETKDRWKTLEVQPILAELIEAFNSNGNLDLIHSKLPFSGEYSNKRDFRGAPLQGLSVNNRNFNEFKFDFADMQGARFTGCRFSDCTFMNSNLTNSHFMECHFTQGFMGGVNLENANLTGSNFYYITLSGSNLKNANFTDVDFGGMLLAGCDLTNTIFTNARLSHCEIVKSREMVNPRLQMMQDLMTSDTALPLDDLRKLLKRLAGETHNIITDEEFHTWIRLYHYFQDKLYHQKSITTSE